MSNFDISKIDKSIIDSLKKYIIILNNTFKNDNLSVYLMGSIALKDYYCDKSDIDFITIKSNIWTDAEKDQLIGIHENLNNEFPNVKFDGVYLTFKQLLEIPKFPNNNAWYLDNKFYKENSDIINPITWKYLKENSLLLVGDENLRVTISSEIVREWCITNVNTYWKNWILRIKNENFKSIIDIKNAIEWGVLGITRLHATIYTNKIVSKLEAGFYAKDTFDKKWNALIETAITIRKNSDVYIEKDSDLIIQMIEYMEMIILECNEKNV